MLFQGRKIRKGESSRALQILSDFRRDKNCVERNVGDLSIRSMSAQEEQSTNQNQIGEKLGQIITMDIMCKHFNRKHQLGGQITDRLEHNLLEIRNFIAKKIQ